ncbi:MAG: adenosylcobinamide-GDP ribazoletransferase [Hahellaceae bacterium]|nr:adenosylcobinamide-GDP ribazoletransferase [Hahellaceae bacterium]MCP5169675.1 adenosylcobinamide-GDP ribazoletransferase [Hahellaceae bacterium]
MDSSGEQQTSVFQREVNLFLIALTFLTRIPVPCKVNYSETQLNQSSRYFPYVGLLIGLLCAVVLGTTAQFLPMPVAVLLSMVFSLLLTGAFHEDGLADTCDGMGGGWTKEQVLTIMKDSRLGTYGAVGLVSVLALKAALLMSLPWQEGMLALIFAHGASRWLSVSYLIDLEYVRDIDSSKVKPLAQQLSLRDFAVASGIGVALLFLADGMLLVSAAGALLVFRMLFRKLLLRKLGGYTGDCLGAAQQISEVLIYLVWVLYVFQG